MAWRGSRTWTAVSVALLTTPGWAWREWTWTTPGPGARERHSFHLFDNQVFVFGGRANDIVVPHTPKTYQIVNVNGTLQFETYDQKPVTECVNQTLEECYDIPIGLFFNDIWRYDLDCARWSDLPCQYEGWHVVDPGARLGGCKILEERLVCTHPSERYGHGSAIFGDGTFFLYGGFSWLCEDYCSDMWRFNLTACLSSAANCTWQRMGELGRDGPGKRWLFASTHTPEKLYLFGGERLWHGFALENSYDNRWSSTSRFPFGGYLDDLWEYSHATHSWRQILPKESCYAGTDLGWEQRNDIHCTIHWPPARSAASIVLSGNALFLFGGFSTFFPYPQVDGSGAGSGTSRRASDGLAPYPDFPFFHKDMWTYEFATGLWREITPLSSVNPVARRGHTMVVAGSIFFLFGGYTSNFYLNDFWLYNTTTNRWLQKETFVHAMYPANCTSDVEALPGGLEYIRGRSVLGQPTRFTTLDGLAGRSAVDVFIEQPRRQATGWDGCRDRQDGRLDLPAKLQWEQPSQRAFMPGVYSPAHRLMLIYGGIAFLKEDLPDPSVTRPSRVQADMWQLHIDNCPKNCSGNGVCHYGYCFCFDGFYGLDCSNISCPGDYCYYDSVTNEQICKHCCAAEYEHYDNETYLPQERKVPCDATHPGESHGICDGFGSCQCAPPFLTMDCSVRDCPNNCSGNGWCSVEYPVSRCMCDPGWIGSDCASRLCLNNCSWPNGFCQSGVCNCTMNPNPFNRSQDYHPFYGDDCSYVVPFAAAPSSYLGPVALLFVSLAAWTLACADETVLEQRRGQRRRRREEDGETGREQERGEERESGCGA